MRFLFAVAVALLVAVSATPSAHAGSLHRSMPRTPRGPEGMARCAEEPMSLAFDVVEREAARFLSPDSLTSRNDGAGPAPRTPARVDGPTPREAENVRVGNAPAAPSKVRRVGAPCGRSTSHASIRASMGDGGDGRLPVDPSTGSDELLIAALQVALSVDAASDHTAVTATVAIQYTVGFAQDAHNRGPWRPPRA